VPGLNEYGKEVKLPDFKTSEEREAEGLDVDEVDLRNQKFLRKKKHVKHLGDSIKPVKPKPKLKKRNRVKKLD